MTPKEKGILADTADFMERFSETPRLTDPGCDDYWRQAAVALSAIGQKWRHHPLAVKVFVGIYEYLEIKQKELSK